MGLEQAALASVLLYLILSQRGRVERFTELRSSFLSIRRDRTPLSRWRRM
jgi:hypothetical protein